MPWAVTPPQKQLILALARGKYRGFNDSHFTEKLCAEEGLSLSRETVPGILRAAKLASPQKRSPRQYRSRRPPRPRFGMMALTDASRHDWLEGRGPELTLIGFQDDATGQILSAYFQLEAENTLGYLRALHAMVAAHGIPLSLYRDRHAIFQRNDADINLAHAMVRVSHKPDRGWTPKAYKEREIPIPAKLVKSLKAWKARANKTCNLVFPTAGCNPKLDFLDCLKAVAERANLGEDNFWLHKFRATFATRCLWAGVDLRTVQQWLGHSDMESTMRYLKPSRSQQVREKVNEIFA